MSQELMTRPKEGRSKNSKKGGRLATFEKGSGGGNPWGKGDPSNSTNLQQVYWDWDDFGEGVEAGGHGDHGREKRILIGSKVRRGKN